MYVIPSYLRMKNVDELKEKTIVAFSATSRIWPVPWPLDGDTTLVSWRPDCQVSSAPVEGSLFLSSPTTLEDAGYTLALLKRGPVIRTSDHASADTADNGNRSGHQELKTGDQVDVLLAAGGSYLSIKSAHHLQWVSDPSNVKIGISKSLMTKKTVVAFSAMAEYGGAFGPFDEDKTVVYNMQTTNIGNAYNTSTGVFTAPVAEMACLEDRLKACEEKIADLVGKEKTMVAFSAAAEYGGAHGPFDGDTTLVYNALIANVGDAYSASTGVFTAPVEGVYCFIFSYHAGGHKFAHLALLKNGEAVIRTLQACEQKIADLIEKEKTIVAFSAAAEYGGAHGPFNRETVLVYNKLFANVGNAYSNST
ncbi:complement C1q-like protein 4, partial [Lates japonicus]